MESDSFSAALKAYETCIENIMTSNHAMEMCFKSNPLMANCLGKFEPRLRQRQRDFAILLTTIRRVQKKLVENGNWQDDLYVFRADYKRIMEESSVLNSDLEELARIVEPLM